MINFLRFLKFKFYALKSHYRRYFREIKFSRIQDRLLPASFRDILERHIEEFWNVEFAKG